MAKLSEKIYSYSPVWFQNVGISLYGYQWKKRRFGGIYQAEQKKFKDREFFSRQTWRDYQTIALRKLLVHAFETVPFYRERYTKAGLSTSSLLKFELENLSKLPFLYKDELRRYGSSTLLSSRREKGGQFFSSSGSTGTPTKILYSHAFHQRMNAAMEARVRNWAGVTADDARGMIGGRRILPSADNTPPYYRYNFFERQTYFSAYHISRLNAANYLKGMKRHKVRYMTGYAMSNYFLAALLDELGLEAPQLKAVITSSEKLTPRMRTMFHKVYGCPTFDSYSGVENCGLISECPEGVLLVSPDVGIMEVLDNQGRPVGLGEEGEVVSTGLLNFDQPLIRYKIGDRITLGANDTSTGGRHMPVVSEIAGRMEDTIVTPDGRQMVRFHGIFVDLPHVLEGQVIQRSLRDFTVNIVTTNGYSPKEDAVILNRMKSQLGDQADIAIQVVDEIPRSANGKFRAVVSEIRHV